MTTAASAEDGEPFWSSPLDYRLPSELIAQRPAPEREQSRLMVVDRSSGGIDHARFDEISAWLRAGDVVVANDSRVMAARLVGRKESGGRIEALVLSAGPQGAVPAMVRSSKAVRAGLRVQLEGGYEAVVVEDAVGGRCLLDFGAVPVATVLEHAGKVPLPPYIRRDADAADRDRYQTVYARRPGSVAAPTAGLHFSAALLADLGTRGIDFRTVTLHVGPGTFAPLRTEIAGHVMEAEHCEVNAETVAAIDRGRASGGRCVAVGTTTVRALETAAAAGAGLRPHAGPTSLFIRPGHSFHAVDVLLTNFHLPGSTLLCLVMAFAGEDLARRAYETAVADRYRFYSYGDAMLIV